jgi:hypothetical protein
VILSGLQLSACIKEIESRLHSNVRVFEIQIKWYIATYNLALENFLVGLFPWWILIFHSRPWGSLIRFRDILILKASHFLKYHLTLADVDQLTPW